MFTKWGGTELLSSPIEIPHTLNWTATSGHTTGTLINPVTDYEYIISIIALFTSATPTEASWQNASLWTRDMINNSIYSNSNNHQLYQGLLPNILPQESTAILEPGKYYGWHIAFGLTNAKTIRINQSVVTGWPDDYKVKLISVKGFR